MLGLLNVIAAGAGAAAMLLGAMAYDAVFDDPAVRRAEHARVMQQVDQAGVKAQLEVERNLRLFAQDKRLKAERQLEAERDSRQQFEAALKAAQTDNEELTDELERLAGRPDRDRVPSVRDLDIRLRNR